MAHELRGTQLGRFCFYTRATFGGCADTTASARPYSVALIDATSVDSLQVDTYCLPPTSCQAIDDASDSISSGTRTCDDHDDCGVVNVSDGYCGAGGRCSYACDEIYQCASDIPSCKLAAGTVRYCQL